MCPTCTVTYIALKPLFHSLRVGNENVAVSKLQAVVVRNRKLVVGAEVNFL